MIEASYKESYFARFNFDISITDKTSSGPWTGRATLTRSSTAFVQTQRAFQRPLSYLLRNSIIGFSIEGTISSGMQFIRSD